MSSSFNMNTHHREIHSFLSILIFLLSVTLLPTLIKLSTHPDPDLSVEVAEGMGGIIRRVRNSFTEIYWIFVQSRGSTYM